MKLIVNLILLLFIISSCDNIGRRRSNLNSENIESSNSNDGQPIDSIYIKFEPNVNFELDILSNKYKQVNVPPDTNFKAYFFDGYSSLVHFPIPNDVFYPINQGDSILISSFNNLPHIQVLNNKKYSDRELNFVAELSIKGINFFEYLFQGNSSVEKAYIQTLVYTDSLYKKGELSDKISNWIKNEALYQYLYLSQTKNVKTDSCLTIDPKQIKSNLNSRIYRNFLWKKMNNLLNKDFSIDHIMTVANTNFAGADKDYVLYQFIRESFSTINTLDANSEVLKLDGHFLDTSYYYVLKKEFLAKYNTDKRIVDQLLQADGKTISFDKMISRYKGKKIYIDVWASWCVPCRHEMTYSRELKKSIAGENVSFVYLSIDNVQNNWLDANTEENLGVVDSYLFTNPKESGFLNKFQINAIPRYIIIDEKGSVISNDAPRPSSKEIKNLLGS